MTESTIELSVTAQRDNGSSQFNPHDVTRCLYREGRGCKDGHPIQHCPPNCRYWEEHR